MLPTEHVLLFIFYPGSSPKRLRNNLHSLLLFLIVFFLQFCTSLGRGLCVGRDMVNLFFGLVHGKMTISSHLIFGTVMDCEHVLPYQKSGRLKRAFLQFCTGIPL